LRLYAPNESPKFQYRSSKISIPSDEITKQMKINQLKEEIEMLQKKDFISLIEELYAILEIDNIIYRSKMIGFKVPFRSAKRTRISRDELGKFYKPDVNVKGNDQFKNIITCMIFNLN